MSDPAPPAAVDLILAKRDGRALTDAEIRWLIAAYTEGAVADEQMSALLMAIYFRGMAPAELRAWTSAMVNSGERLDLGSVVPPTVDKHSTGGVGDKVSLILAPLVPCGRCRQLLLEHGGPGLLLDADGGPMEIGALLPSAFTGTDLAARRETSG